MAMAKFFDGSPLLFATAVGLRSGLKMPRAAILETTSSASLIILSISSLTVGMS
jgi:hypothetical protein